jgi:hypothetical protein
VTPREGMICLVGAAMLSGWPTPTAKEKAGGATTDPDKVLARALGGHSNDLQDFVQLVTGWATPQARDYRTPAHQSYRERGGGAKGETLNHQVAHQIPGATLNGLAAATANTGLLNPEHSRWLQGIPATWPSCAPTATRSIRSPRRSSSAPSSNVEKDQD